MTFWISSCLLLTVVCGVAHLRMASSLVSRGRECDSESPVAAEASCEHFQAEQHSVFGWSRLAQRLCPPPHPRTRCRPGSHRTESAGKRDCRHWEAAHCRKSLRDRLVFPSLRVLN